MRTLNDISTRIKNFLTKYKESRSTTFTPSYRLVEIVQKGDENFVVTIQVINKNITFQTKPEEILAEDNLVNQFSPTDIRALTYLGYLGINSPKYKILAKNLSVQDNSIIFTIKKKGEKEPISMKASDLAKDKNLLNNIHPNDAHIIGYTAGMEQTANENALKKEILASLENSEKDQ